MILREGFDFNKIVSKPVTSDRVKHVNWQVLNSLSIREVLIYVLGSDIFRPFKEKDCPFECSLPDTKVLTTSISDPNSQTYKKIDYFLDSKGWKCFYTEGLDQAINDTTSDAYTSLGYMAETIQKWVNTYKMKKYIAGSVHYIVPGCLFISPDNGLYLIYIYDSEKRRWHPTWGYTGNVLYTKELGKDEIAAANKNKQQIIKDINKIIKFYKNAKIPVKYFQPVEIPGCKMAIKATGKYDLNKYKATGLLRYYVHECLWMDGFSDLNFKWGYNQFIRNNHQEISPEDYPEYMKSLPKTSIFSKAMYSVDNQNDIVDDIFSFMEATDTGEYNWYITVTDNYEWEGKGKEAIRVKKS